MPVDWKNTEKISRSELIHAAREAARNAYCPFSNFRVGAALVADGKVFTGANVENSSYGVTLCAERSALSAAISSGARHITEIAVACIDADKSSGVSQLMPCGACRQWLSDLAPDGIVFVDGIKEEFRVADLMPYPFRI